MFTTGSVIYLGILSRRTNNVSTTANIDAPRPLLPSSQSIEGAVLKGTIVETKSITGEITRYIHGEVVSFDGNLIRVTWQGSSDTIAIWQGGEEVQISNKLGERSTLKRGELKLDSGDYVSFQTKDRILVIIPKNQRT